MPKIDLWQGDCLELMKRIPDGSVDFVLTDPPYQITACRWDKLIPFEPMWTELKRIIKPNGAICLFGSEPFSSALRMSNIKQFKYDWVWKKSKATGHVHAKNKPMKKHEMISVFSPKGNTLHEGQSVNRIDYYPQGLRKLDNPIVSGLRPSNTVMGARPSHRETVQHYTNYPTSVLCFSSETGKHPTQKPVALLEYLIKTYTLEGETVLDFTAGSFSTGVAAVNLNRSFIGIELDKDYFEIGKKRVEDAQRINNA